MFDKDKEQGKVVESPKVDKVKKPEGEATIIYKVPGLHRGPKGTTYAWRDLPKGAKTPDGWHSTLKKAMQKRGGKNVLDEKANNHAGIL